jgi:hypothetical protein
MNRDLFLAILSMDSYNRRYGQGVILNQGDSTTNQNEAGRQLGRATILNFDLPQGSVAAGFYALAYDMTGVSGFAAGERVISYRGSDEGRARDIINGYPAALGWPLSAQGNLAIAFARAVAGADVLPALFKAWPLPEDSNAGRLSGRQWRNAR